MKISSHVVSVVIFGAVVMPAAAVVLTGGAGITNGAPYPYTQTLSDPGGSFDVIMDASLDSGPAQLYVSTFTGLGIQRSASGSGTSDYRQINADEFLEMTITNLSGGSAVNFTQINGSGSYFGSGKFLYFYKNGVPVRTNACDGSGSYDIFPPISAQEGDTISFNPSANVRLENFTLELVSGFPASDEPYISDAAATTTLLDTVISSNGHYFITADWSGLAHQPDGVVVKVGNGDAVTRLYYMGAMGPDTPAVDFDLLILQPGDTVKVVAGLTGNAGEDPGQWSVSLDRYDSWSGSRYEVTTVPLGLAAPLSGLDIHKNLWPRTSGFRNDYRAFRGEDTVLAFVAETLGHAPKVYDEEINHGPPNLPYLQAYAENNPDRQVMAHWNGKNINLDLSIAVPEKVAEFKPYHFKYDVGSYLSSAISSNDTQITVDDPGPFSTNEVAIIVPVDPVTGERQFDGSEMVLVTAISGNQLTVIREVYKDKISNVSSAFGAGSYIAPSIKNMQYNYALNAPVGTDGRNGGDMVVEMLSHEFKPGENLERFHGVMFDVLSLGVDETEDLNLDGVADGRYDARGIDLYHLGVQGMARKLRAALPGRILTFDGPSGGWPALQTVFNGIEAEGFSHHHDTYTKKWSLSPNYFLYTKRWNPSEYQYNFCVPKQGGEPSPGSPEESLRVKRFHLAGMVAMGVTLSHQWIEASIFGPFYAMDEMVKGVDVEQQWLGAPLGDLIRPGFSAPDQLGGSGLPSGGWSSPDGSATVSNGVEGLVVVPVDTGIDHDMTIEFSGISIPEGDLLIRFEGKGGLPHYPSDTARDIKIEVDGRVQNGLTDDTLSGPVNNDGFTAVTAYYRSAGPAGGTNVTLRLIIESAEDMTLRNFTIHNATDTMVREFENGIVLCNSSENPHTFDLSSLFPGQSFRRIQGRVLYNASGNTVVYDQTHVNDGSAVGSALEIEGYGGLFLVRTGSVIPGEAYTIVDYTPLDSYKSTLSPDIDTLTGDTWTFSDSDPMVSDQGTNTTVFGGLVTTWTGPEDYEPNIRNKTGELQLQINPVDETYITAKGVYLWPKAEFLNGAGATLSFEPDDVMYYESGWFAASQKNVRFVVNQGGTYYVSEFLSSEGQVTLNPTTTHWAPLDTNDYSYGSFASLTLDDVQGVGLYLDLNRSGNQLAFEMIDFQATAHTADYYTLWASGYSLTGSNALESADIELDGINNYLEYALGGNPTNSDASSIMPAFAITSGSGSNKMEYVYRRRNDYLSRGIDYVVESSTNLVSGTWTTNGVMQSGSGAIDASFDMVTNQVPVDGTPQQFIRLRVE